MNNDYKYPLEEFLGKVIDDEKDIKKIDEDEVIERIQEYDRDYAICHMDDYVEKINFADCIEILCF